MTPFLKYRTKKLPLLGRITRMQCSMNYPGPSIGNRQYQHTLKLLRVETYTMKILVVIKSVKKTVFLSKADSKKLTRKIYLTPTDIPLKEMFNHKSDANNSD